MVSGWGVRTQRRGSSVCPTSRSEEQSDEMPGYMKGIPGSSKWLGLRAACKEWKKVR